MSLCLMPGRHLPHVTIWEFDKFIHFGMYVVLAVLMYYGWRKQDSFSGLHTQTFLKILLVSSAYGFAVEVMQQALTADRQFDLLDALANSAGAIAGSFLGARFIK